MLIDIHTHATLYQVIPCEVGVHYLTPEGLVAEMDRLGVDMAAVLPLSSPAGRRVLIPTEQVLEACARFPGRLIPFCNIDPRQEGNAPDSDFTLYFEAYRERGCKGMGEVTANLPFDDPLVFNLMAHCERAGLPLTFHIAPAVGGYYGLVDELGLPRLERALERFPGLPFLGHSQPFWAEISADASAENRNSYPPGPVIAGGRVSELLDRYPNLYGDLSANSGYNALHRDPEFGYGFLEQYQDRLLFGTDLLRPDQPTPIVDYLQDAVAGGRISPGAFNKITYQNAVRLLGLDI